MPAPAKLLESAPIRFEPNSGLQPAPIRWIARGRGYSFAFTDRATLFHVADATVRLSFPGAKRGLVFQGERQQSASTNYFIGDKRISAPAYTRLRETGVYPGIDVVYYGNGAEIEYDFEIAPGADPSRIRMRFEGADAVRLNASGEIVLTLRDGEVTQRVPVVYQKRPSGEIVSIQAAYRIARDGTVRLTLGGYNPAEPLIVDPTIVYAAYLSGSIADTGIAVAHDAKGIIYLAGTTESVDFPVSADAYQPANAGNLDCWFMKLDPNGGSSAIIYSSYIGGAADDTLKAMTIDQNGLFYLTGSAISGNYPVTSGALVPTNAANTHGFVSMIDPTLGVNGLIYSSYLGGTLNDEGDGIAVANGLIYVSGTTESTDFPLPTTTYQATLTGGFDAFVVAIDPTQSGAASEVGGTYLGGVADDAGRTVAVDSAGLVYVAGTTFSFGFPITGNAYQPAYAGDGDAFLSVLNLTAGTLVYSTFLGGSSEDEVKKMVIDPSGNVAMTGYTLSYNFPVTQSAFQPVFGGVSNAFLSILDLKTSQQGVGLTYSTFYGGTGGEVAYDLKLDAYGRYTLGGYTLSQNLPVTSNALFPNSFQAGIDGFIAVIDPTASGSGNGLVFGTYITGPGTQTVYGVDVINPPPSTGTGPDITDQRVSARMVERHAASVNPTVQIYSTGVTTSSIFPNGTPQNTDPGKYSAFVLGFELQAPPAAGSTGVEVTAAPRTLRP
jgi:hypothetical protein